MKKKNLWIIALVAIITVAFITCDNGNDPLPPQDLPKEQGDTGNEITNLFGKGYSVNISGYMTNSEWTIVVVNIKFVLENRYEEYEALYDSVFGQAGGITIIVEKSPNYANYSTTRNGNTVKINFSITNDTNVLGTALHNATRVMSGHPTAPEVG